MKTKPEISQRRATLIDVAAAAGVSAITVSRTLRSPEKVSERARLKVEAAIERLGYVPDPAASALASRTTSNIGLLVPSLTNNVFADVLRGVYGIVDETRYFIQIGNFRYSALTEEALIRTFLRQKPAGLIVSGFDQTEAARDLLGSAACPIVQIMAFGPEPVDMAVGLRHDAAGRAATRHLLACGYRRPGFLGARMDPRTQQRLAGFRAETDAAGLRNEARIVTTPLASSVGLGRQLLELLLSQAPDTDAVFCNNDDLAIGALMEALRRRIAVPDAFGICGFNDIEMAQHMYPSLTSVATPRHEIGRRAAEMILAEIATPGSVTTRNVDLGFQLVARNTTRAR